MSTDPSRGRSGDATHGTRPVATFSGAAAGALILAAVVVSQSAVHWREDLADSHLFAYFGWRVFEGDRPYRDLWDNKPPGIWWINALAYAVGGEGAAGEVLVCGVALGAALAALAGIARSLFGPSFALLSLVAGGLLLTHPRYECGANRTETFVVACELLAVYAYVRWARGGAWSWLALGAAAAGTAPWFKQSGLAAAGACAAHLAWWQCCGRAGQCGLHVDAVDARASTGSQPSPLPRRLRPWLVATTALCLPSACAAAALAAQGCLQEAWRAVVTFNRAYFAVHDASWMPLPGALHVFAPELPPLYGVLFVALCGPPLAIIGWVRGSRGPAPSDRFPGGPLLLWAWFVLAAYLACVGPGRRAYHLAPTLGPLALLALGPLAALCGRRSLGAMLLARPSFAVCVVAFLAALGRPAEDYARRAAACWSGKPAWYALRRGQPTGEEQRGAAIRRLTTPADSVYVWGWSPGTYRYAHRRCASRYATIEKLGQVGAHAAFILQGAIADIRRAPPAVFVVSVADLAAMGVKPEDDFGRWLRAGYEDQGVIEGMHLLLRRR